MRVTRSWRTEVARVRDGTRDGTDEVAHDGFHGSREDLPARCSRGGSPLGGFLRGKPARFRLGGTTSRLVFGGALGHEGVLVILCLAQLGFEVTLETLRSSCLILLARLQSREFD